MNTKLNGDIAEQAVTLDALKRGFGVSISISDRLPYNLIIDIGQKLLEIQVKCAWWDVVKSNYVVDNRRTKTNRQEMKRSAYANSDFDFFKFRWNLVFP